MRTTQIFKSILIVGILITSLQSCKEDDPQDPIAEPLVLECNDLVATGASLTLVDRGSGVDYIINCEAKVRGDLKIDPNVTIQFGSDAGIDVSPSGSISAIGSASSPIIFTGEDKVKGSWKGIILESDDVKNKLSFCTLEYAGSGAFNSNGDIGGVIIWASSKIEISNCTIQFCSEYGINATYGDLDLILSNNNISNCDLPMFVEAKSIHNISGGTYTGNVIDAIRVSSDNGSKRINEVHTWLDLGVPFRIQSDLYVGGGRLTINPGVVMEFENGAGIKIGDSDASTLIAVGTSSNPILFTGVTKSAGAWLGLEFDFTNSPENEVAYAKIEYAGSGSNASGIYMWAEPVLSVHDVTFENISGCAFRAEPTTTSFPNNNLTETNNTFTSISGGLSC